MAYNFTTVVHRSALTEFSWNPEHARTRNRKNASVMQAL